MTSLLFSNLLAWSAQICILTTFAALAALMLKHPRGRLIFWQGISVVTLLLPAIEPWSEPLAHEGAVSIATAPAAVIQSAPGRFAFLWRSEYLFYFLAAGTALRMIWIAAGLLRLRRYRLQGRAIPAPLEQTRVRWYISDSISSPVTFGWLRPSILLPSRMASLPEPMRQVIFCHELIHVRRRDWLFVLAEESIRALLWFHPAAWFALSRIQLAREQVVDLEAVRLTGDRDRYLDALVAVAAQRLDPDLAPAPLFLKKHHLATRVAALLGSNFKETRMSKSRVIASFTAVSSAALLAAFVAVWFFPLRSLAQSVLDSPGISVNPGGTLMHRAPVLYNGSTTGTVVLQAALNSKGEVAEAHVVSGPDALQNAALQSVLKWHYSPETGRLAEIAIKFDAVPNLAGNPPPLQATIKSIRVVGASPQAEQQVRSVLPVHEGDAADGGTMSRVLAAAQAIDEHFTGVMNVNGNHEATVTLKLPPASIRNPAPEGVILPPSQNVTPVGPRRLRVGGMVAQTNLITRVVPLYPSAAKRARVQGVVHFEALIGTDGQIESLKLISGEPSLAEAAAAAVKQWIYKPTLLNGVPVEVATQIDVNFTLAK